MNDERYLRLSDVLLLLDMAAWYDDARNSGHLNVDEVSGARWLQSWVNEKIAGLDWLAGRAVQDDLTTLVCGCVIDKYQLLISCSAEHAPES